jgi:hypothetical protein
MCKGVAHKKWTQADVRSFYGQLVNAGEVERSQPVFKKHMGIVLVDDQSKKTRLRIYASGADPGTGAVVQGSPADGWIELKKNANN